MLRSGHAPGHVRDTFIAAVEAFLTWKDGEPEPTVEFEVRYEPRQIPISRACGLVWGCTDVMPGLEFRALCDAVDIWRQTYAAAARAMLECIKRMR